MQLRPYQLDALTRLRAALHNRPILVSPTGSGKTVIGAELVRRFDGRVLWLAHRKELIDQAALSLLRLGVRAGIIMAGYPDDPGARVQVASVQTLRRCETAVPGLIVVDECHHATANTYGDILSRFPSAAIVGLTATPFRLDGSGLGDVFGEIVVSVTPGELAKAGFLLAPKVYAGRAPDLRSLRVVAGDYRLDELAQREAVLTADIVETWQRRSDDRRTVCFAVNVEHSQQIVAAFADAGIAAEHLDGTCDRRTREGVLQRLRCGATKIVSNCMVLTEGWDLPALEVAIIARPTASLNLHLQMIGRIMRACDGKQGAVVLDHAGNVHVHGLVTRELEYSLDGKTTGEHDPLGVKRCPSCFLMVETSQRFCECGHDFATAQETRPVSVRDGELEEYEDDYEYRLEFWRLLEAQREAWGYKPGWSAYRYKERFGEWPLTVAGDLVDPAHATMDQKREVYRRLLATARERGFKDGWASHRYKNTFGVWPTGFVGQVKGPDFRRLEGAWKR